MYALVSIPEEGVDVLSKALSSVYGEDVINIIMLDRDNLRQRVRLSTNGNGALETVLIALDVDSFEACADIINSSENEKVIKYESLDKFVEKINELFNLSISVKNNSNVNSSDLNKKLHEKDLMISNLYSQIQELEKELNFIGVSPSNSDKENLEFEKEISRLKKSVEGLEKSKKFLSEEKSRILAELEEFKVNYSLQVGLLDEKDSELNEKSKEILALKSEKKSIQQELDTIKGIVKDKEEKVFTLEKELSNSASKDKVDEYNKIILELNQEKVEMQGRINLLEKSTSRDTDIESLELELNELKIKYGNLQNSIFYKLSTSKVIGEEFSWSLPILKSYFNNLEFVFSGSTESRKGTYKAILNRCKEDKETKYLIFDMSTETYVDYVFEMKGITGCINWLLTGENMENYLSDTCLENVSVLAPGLTFLSDIFYLNFNMEDRLEELENSGYKVIVYCGDLSSVVSRVLFETMLNKCSVKIYVHGNAIGCRSIITNITGLKDYSKAEIYYFDYNPQLERFYNIMSKTNKCTIIREESK